MDRHGMSVTVLAMIMVVGGCQGGMKMDSSTEPVPILAMHHGDDSGLSDQVVLLINSQAQLERTGSEELLNKGVDFDQASLVVLALGERPTGGHWARITGLQAGGGTLYVQGIANRPDRSGAVTQVMSYPYCAVEVAKLADLSVNPEIKSVEGQSLPE